MIMTRLPQTQWPLLAELGSAKTKRRKRRRRIGKTKLQPPPQSPQPQSQLQQLNFQQQLSFGFQNVKEFFIKAKAFANSIFTTFYSSFFSYYGKIKIPEPVSYNN